MPANREYHLHCPRCGTLSRATFQPAAPAVEGIKALAGQVQPCSSPHCGKWITYSDETLRLGTSTRVASPRVNDAQAS